MPFETRRLPADRDVVAPDGSDVRVLLGLAGGGMAHFSLEASQTSVAVTHRSVEEIWYVLSGAGEIWRRQGDETDVAVLGPGVCVSIPLGTAFQFRSAGPDSLAVVAVTMPPWPGAGEAVAAEGPWEPTVGEGPDLSRP